MARVSPTLEGFRAAFRRPSLTFAEIMWRWVFGASAGVLLFFGFFEYLDTLPVTNGEVFFLQTKHPFLVAQALAHILRGSLGRVVASMILAATMLALLWMIVASIGRIATVRFLLEYFRERFVTAGDSEITYEPKPVPAVAFAPLLRIQFLRIAVVLAALVGLGGAGILAGFASPERDPRPGIAFLLFVPIAALIAWLAWALNWLLSLAAVFAIRDGGDAIGSVGAAVSLCRERTGAVFAVSTWTGLAHFAVFSAASTVVAVPLGMAGWLPGRLVVLGVVAATLAYFAVVDWLYMARLAGYVSIAEMPESMFAPEPEIPAPPALLQTTIDRSELILSDVPASAG